MPRPSCFTRPVRVAAVAALLVSLTGGTASAQYFGKNKVRYSEFDFQVLSTEHFDIYYYEREQRAIEEAARLAERWYERLSAVLDHEFVRRQPLVLYASHPDFRQTTVIPGFIGESTGGVTEALRNRVVMPFTASLQETSHVLGHELVHAFQFDMAGVGALRLPLWFVEGMAEYLSLGPVHSQTALWIRDAAAHEDLPGFEDLDNPGFFPYRFGHAAWAYIAGRWGDDAIPTLFLAAAKIGDPLEALRQLTGMEIEQISAAWHDAVYATYASVLRADLSPRGRPLVTEAGEGGELNIGPALSPDGEHVVFLSEKDLFSIDMFLANARTGEVIRKLTDIATDPHFDSIQFLESTGAWAADGRRFVYGLVRAANPVFVIIDAATGEKLREIELPSLGEAINPTWSPDNRYLAFSGLVGGVSDLFIYDLQENRLEQVTRDLHTQIQPKWSPDGRTIAVVTDQFGAAGESLAFGNYRIGLFDVATGETRPAPGFDDAKNINPHWAPDGRALYFLADPNGIPNIFRVSLATGDITPITTLLTGATGITATSPALSVASNTGRLVYTLFNDRKYELYAIDAEDAPPSGVPLQRVNAAVLPPPRTTSRLAALLRAPETLQLTQPREYPVEDYDPDLALEYIGAAATTGFGAGSLGTAIGGGIALQFSDLLNFHQLTAVVDANARSVRDIGGQLTYLNQSTRWNLGAAVQWLPYVTGSFSQGVAELDGRTVIVERERIFRQTNRQIIGIAEYPLNRAARVETSAGLRSIGFDREVTTRIFSASTGRLLEEDVADLAAPETLNLAQATGAFVYDTAVFGATSPVLGTRSRFEVTPTFGGLSFAEVLADARRYVVPVRPLTLAGRILHVGRYGGDAEDQRLTPLFLGYPSLVRGYELGSFDAGECLADGVSACPAFDQLVGSRIVVANAELRFPLVGIFQGEFNYGPLPVEGFVFGDAGVAWTSDEEPEFLAGNRSLVTSAGAGLRVNALGYLVFELAAVRPFDRPDDSWRFVFNIVPGF